MPPCQRRASALHRDGSCAHLLPSFHSKREKEVARWQVTEFEAVQPPWGRPLAWNPFNSRPHDPPASPRRGGAQSAALRRSPRLNALWASGAPIFAGRVPEPTTWNLPQTSVVGSSSNRLTAAGAARKSAYQFFMTDQKRPNLGNYHISATRPENFNAQLVEGLPAPFPWSKHPFLCGARADPVQPRSRANVGELPNREIRRDTARPHCMHVPSGLHAAQ